MGELLPVKEAAKRVGIHETTIYGHAKRGNITITRKEVDGKKRAFVDIDELANRGYTASTNGEVDPFDAALDAFIAAARDLRKAAKEHDKRVRREAVRDLVDSLQEGLR